MVGTVPALGGRDTQTGYIQIPVRGATNKYWPTNTSMYWVAPVSPGERNAKFTLWQGRLCVGYTRGDAYADGYKRIAVYGDWSAYTINPLHTAIGCVGIE